MDYIQLIYSMNSTFTIKDIIKKKIKDGKNTSHNIKTNLKLFLKNAKYPID